MHLGGPPPLGQLPLEPAPPEPAEPSPRRWGWEGNPSPHQASVFTMMTHGRDEDLKTGRFISRLSDQVPKHPGNANCSPAWQSQPSQHLACGKCLAGTLIIAVNHSDPLEVRGDLPFQTELYAPPPPRSVSAPWDCGETGRQGGMVLSGAES